MYVLLFCARAGFEIRSKAPDHPAHADFYCWVRADHPHEAERLARRLIREAGWIPRLMIDARLVERDDYDARDVEALELFDEAVIQGASSFAHCYDEEDEDVRCPVHDARVGERVNGSVKR